MLDQGSCICDNSTGSTTDMLIKLKYFFNAFGDDKSGIESSFNGKDNTLIDFDSNSWGSKLKIYVDDTLMASIAY